MSSLGDESAQIALKVSTQAMEEFVKLMKFLLDRNGNVEKKLKKEQLKDLKEKRQERTDSTRIGYVRSSKMLNSGLPVSVIKTPMTDEELKEFSYYAKKFGIAHTSILNKFEKGERKTRLVQVYEKDLEAALDITNIMNRNMKLEAINEKIETLKNDTNRSEHDQERLNCYQYAKEKLLKEDTLQFNSINHSKLFSELCGLKEEESQTFDEALNHFTDRDYSQSEPYYLCERTNPNIYMELISSRDEYNGDTYTRTDYRLFNNDTEILNKDSEDGVYTDKRFEGRSKTYWKNLKLQMMQDAGFSNDVIVFNNRNEFELYRDSYVKCLEQANLNHENHNFETSNNGFVNYGDVIQDLNNNLNEKNMVLASDGSIQSKDPLKSVDTNSPDYAEAYIISKQIRNYEMMSLIQTDIALKQHEINMEQSVNGVGLNNKVVLNLQNEIDELQNQYLNLKEEEKSLHVLRMKSIGLKCEQITAEFNNIETPQQVQEFTEVLQNGSTENIEHDKVSLDEVKREVKKITSSKENTHSTISDAKGINMSLEHSKER